jgi:uncharacterized protein
MFIDRESEIAQLETRFHSGKAELFIVYGRRRVGKTELLRAFCLGKTHLFFIATLSSDSDQLANFSQQIYMLLHGSTPEGFTYPSWESALRILTDIPGRPVIIMDEFTYLIGGNKALPSILQKVWDETLRSSQVMMILCGSYIGMMETQVLGYQAPLYGRRSGSVLLEPLGLTTVPAFFPGYSPIQRMEAWAVLGGMPYYLHAFTDSEDIFTNVHRQIIDRSGLLHAEPRLLFLEELREPRNYFSILRAIASGRRRLGEIASGAGVGDSPVTARYLDLLQQMRLVQRYVPVTESQPHKSKKGLYKVSDPFLGFWFRYVHPYQNLLDLDLAEIVMTKHIRPTFDQFVSYAFEDAAHQHIARITRSSRLPFIPERIGRWWNDQEEIDVVALSSEEQYLLAGECKWTARPIGTDILENLKRKSRLLLNGKNWQVIYYLFSKSGFTPALQELTGKEPIHLVNIEAFFEG